MTAAAAMKRDERLECYVRAALDRACADIRAAGAGERNRTVSATAYSIGRLVGAPGSPLSRGDAEREIEAAALTVATDRSFTPRNARYTLSRALDQGEATPADLSHVGKGDRPPQRPPRLRKPTPAPRTADPAPPRPEGAEVSSLWESARPVDTDADAIRWLRDRRLDPGKVADLDLARVILEDGPLPPWARFKGRPWTATGHRLAFRAWDATGAPASLHVRSVAARTPDGVPKGLWPAAGPGSAAGLVFADPLAVSLLRGDRVPWWPLDRSFVAVAEGPSDWLTLATIYSAASEDTPATIGVEAGSATPALAARIPDGARVVIATDPDPAGDRYAEEWRALLADRCDVRRWRR